MFLIGYSFILLFRLRNIITIFLLRSFQRNDNPWLPFTAVCSANELSESTVQSAVSYIPFKTFIPSPLAVNMFFYHHFRCSKTCHYPMDFTEWKPLYHRKETMYTLLPSVAISFLRVAKSIRTLNNSRSFPRERQSFLHLYLPLHRMFYLQHTFKRKQSPCVKRHFLYPAITHTNKTLCEIRCIYV